MPAWIERVGWIKYGWAIGSLPVILLLTAWFFPYAASIYFAELGGRLAEEAAGMQDIAKWQTAAGYLQRAVQFDRRNSHAYRLLGQAYLAQGQAAPAAQALQQFVERRPQHPAGQMELAQALDAARAALPGLIDADLVSLAAEATISTPDQVDGHPFRAGDYVYTRTLALYAPSDAVQGLFLHPASAVTYTLTLTRPVHLRFGLGNVLYAPEWQGDGVTFEVWVNGERLFLEHLTPDMARQGWQWREVDLAAYTGQTIRLRLATTPGPVGDLTADWAVWGRPRVEAPEALSYWQALTGYEVRDPDRQADK